jgi:hypothetical protein
MAPPGLSGSPSRVGVYRILAEATMAESGSANSVGALEKLDGNVPTRFYWQLTLLATIGGFLFGYDTANIGAALTVLPYQLGDFASGYLVAGASLGAAAGALCAGRCSSSTRSSMPSARSCRR